MSELHVVFGTTGSGGAVIRELVTRGKQVRAVNRHGSADLPAGVEVVKADALDLVSTQAALIGATTLYHAIGLPYYEWYSKFPAMMDNLINAASATNTRFVYIDNVYGYGRVNGPMTEDLAYKATTRKGILRAQLAQQLMRAHSEGKVRATIGRGSDFYGTGVTSALLNDKALRSMLVGKKLAWPSNLDTLFTMTYISDFAKGIATLGEREEALGEVWHIPTASPATGRQILQFFFEAASLPPKIGVLSRTTLRIAQLFNPMAREFLEMLYEYEEPYLFDSSKYQRTFGDVVPTSLKEGTKETIAWLRSHVQSPALV